MFFLLSLLTVCLLSSSDVSASVSADNQSSYQTAFLYFLPDYEPKQIDEAEARGCSKLGYTYTRSNCASPRILKDKCPAGNAYKTCFCAGSPDCTGSTSSSNPYPSSTGASRTSCINCPGNTLYTWTCSGCDAYTLSSCPSHGNCTKCCDGYYKLDSCASGYHIEGRSCIPNCIPEPNEYGCSYGTMRCLNGCGGTRTCCRPAPSSSPIDGSSSGGNAGGNSGKGSCSGSTCDDYRDCPGYMMCCDDTSHPICQNMNPCSTYLTGNCSFVRKISCGGIYNGYSVYKCE